jgi:hypothetical protein
MSPFIRSFHTERFIFFLFPAFSGHSFSSVTLYVAKTVPNQFFGQNICHFNKQGKYYDILSVILAILGKFDRIYQLSQFF